MNDGFTLPTLTALRVSNGALSGDSLPNRLKVLGWGRSESVKGPIVLDAQSAASLAKLQRGLGFEKVAIDYEHGTVPGTAEYDRTKEPRPVAGYGVPEVVPGEGLFLSSIEWTPSGRESARNFADLSPAVGLDDSGRVTFLHSVALTRNGAVHDLSFFSVGSNQNPMNEKMIPLAVLAGALGLKADAAEADIQAKLTTVISSINSLSALERRLIALESSKPEPITVLSATVDGKEVQLKIDELLKLSARVEGIEKRFNDQVSASEVAEKTRLIQSFSAKGQVPLGEDGKPLGAGQLVALPLDMLRMLSANTPATVPLNARGGRPNEQQKRDDLKGAERAGQAWSHLSE